ncbi:MAG: 6-phosphogluconolactonase [Sodalis sp. Fse]|nr:MAG: 6-phosphogluconolactonase [Sodalis sp. Fse]
MKHIVYVASQESQQIHVWQMDNQGTLTLLQVVDTPGQGQPMAIHPTKSHLYIGVRPTFSVVSYLIDKQRLLSEAGITIVPGSPTHLTIDLQGQFLYCASYSNSSISVIPLDQQGMTGAPLQTLEGLTNCHSANVDTTNQVLWIPCLKEDRIRLFNIGEAGKLTAQKPEAVDIVTGSGPRHMAFHHSGRYAYAINELNSTVNVFAIDTGSGRPQIVQTLDMMPTNFNDTRWAADIHLTPDGRWLYCSDRTANIISCFGVYKCGGALRLLSHKLTENQPRSFALDTGGRYLVAAGQKSHHIAVYAINQHNGELTLLSRYAVGHRPMWVSIIDL